MSVNMRIAGKAGSSIDFYMPIASQAGYAEVFVPLATELGRVFLVQAKLTPTTVVPARTELDIEGQVLAVRDALGTDAPGSPLGRVCANSTYSILARSTTRGGRDPGLEYEPAPG